MGWVSDEKFHIKILQSDSPFCFKGFLPLWAVAVLVAYSLAGALEEVFG